MFRQFNSDSFPNQIFGIFTGTFVVSQLPNVPGKLFKLKVRSLNSGSIFLGSHLNTGQFPLPYMLQTGYESEWFNADNLNQFYIGQASGSNTILMYWVQK